MLEARGMPTCLCPNCGSKFFNIVVQFDPTDYEIGMYFLDAECVKCGTLTTAPTPLDHPNNLRREK
jgi:rRNA maturation protein Nop10